MATELEFRVGVGGLLMEDGIDAARIAEADVIELGAFGIRAVRRSVMPIEDVGPPGILWRGQVAGGLGDGSAVLAIRDGRISGRIHAAHAVVIVEPTATGTHRIVEVDPDRFEDCGGGVEVEVEVEVEEAAATTVPAASTGSGSNGAPVTIDVLVLYTAASVAAAGDEAALLATIDVSMATVDDVFSGSQVPARMRQIAALPTPLAESGDLEEDLARLAMDPEVGRLRDAHGADIVALIVEHQGSCGQAYVHRQVGSSFAPLAFQVTARHCAVANLSFAHEMAHLLGAEHDPANGIPPSYASFRWSFGHLHRGVYRTLMTYSWPCPGCPRLPYLSNPSILVEGLPAGIDGRRDNARTVRDVAPIVAGFRRAIVFADGFESGDVRSWDR